MGIWVTTTPGAGSTALASLLLLLLFLVLLIQKEIAGSLEARRAQRINRVLTISLVPLALIVGYTVITRLIAVLR